MRGPGHVTPVWRPAQAKQARGRRRAVERAKTDRTARRRALLFCRVEAQLGAPAHEAREGWKAQRDRILRRTARRAVRSPPDLGEGAARQRFARRRRPCPAPLSPQDGMKRGGPEFGGGRGGGLRPGWAPWTGSPVPRVPGLPLIGQGLGRRALPGADPSGRAIRAAGRPGPGRRAGATAGRGAGAGPSGRRGFYSGTGYSATACADSAQWTAGAASGAGVQSSPWASGSIRTPTSGRVTRQGWTGGPLSAPWA